jgi:uncharacterized protein YybS (DUF2232 family)
MTATSRAGEHPEASSIMTLGAALGAALLFAVVRPLGPVLGPLLAAVSPLPLIIHRLGRGLVPTVFATLLAATLVGWFYTPGAALVFLAFLLVPGLMIGEAMARGRGLPRGCQWAFAFLTVEISLALLFAGPDLASQVTTVFDRLRDPQALQEMKSSGWAPETVDLWVEQSKVLEADLRVVYPAVFVIAGGLVVLANAFLLKVYLLRRDPGWVEGGEFEGIRWPLGLPLVFILSGLGVLLPPIRPAAYNVLLVVTFFFILQGLAVITYYAHRLAGPPFLRRALILLVLVNLWANTWAPLALALVGLFDIFFDFRKWGEPPKTQGA